MQKGKVLDLSGYNDPESYSEIKKAGINFIILKAINKNLNPDKRFEQHLKGCTDAGIKVIGTYHYSYATTVSKAKEAARAWIRTVGSRCNMFYLDWEDASLPKDSRAVEIINAYADEIHRAGHEFAVYCGLSWYNSYLKKYADKLPYDFWIARYYAGDKGFSPEDNINEKYMPVITHNLSGWQYTASGSVPGIKGCVDISIWYGDLPISTADKISITVELNPFTEPEYLVKLGCLDTGAMWTQWYLWRFGLIQKEDINGLIGKESDEAIREAQRRLGLKDDGIVGPVTKSIWKKIC